MARIADVVHVETVPKCLDCFWESFSKLFAQQSENLLRGVWRTHVAEEHAIPLVAPCFVDETMVPTILWVKQDLKEHLRNVSNDCVLELAKTKENPSEILKTIGRF